jgi:hypothetical protein
MRKGVTIALAISLMLGAAVAWGSCAVPRRAGDVKASHASPTSHRISAHPGDANHVAIMSKSPNYALN